MCMSRRKEEFTKKATKNKKTDLVFCCYCCVCVRVCVFFLLFLINQCFVFCITMRCCRHCRNRRCGMRSEALPENNKRQNAQQHLLEKDKTKKEKNDFFSFFLTKNVSTTNIQAPGYPRTPNTYSNSGEATKT